MLGMFWIALELSNPMVGLITRISLLAKNLTAFKFGKVAKSGNAACNASMKRLERNPVRNSIIFEIFESFPDTEIEYSGSIFGHFLILPCESF